MPNQPGTSRRKTSGCTIRRRSSSRAATRSAPSVGSPAVPELVEHDRGAAQPVQPAVGQPDQLAPGVGGVVGAFQVAERDQPVDGLARRLLGDAEALAQLGGGGAVDADGLEDEAVHRAQVGVALPGQLGVQVVDERTEAGEQEQGECEAGAVRRCHVRQPRLLSGQPR